MQVPPEFLINYNTEELVFRDCRHSGLLYHYGPPLYWLGGWPPCRVSFSPYGQAHDSELLNSELALVHPGPLEHTSISLHHLLDFGISGLQAPSSC